MILCTRLTLFRGAFAALLAIILAAPCSAEVVGNWSFDGDLLDRSGFGHDGQFFNSPVAFTDDVSDMLGGGQALSFTGTNGEGVLVPDTDALDMKTEHGGMAISAWIKMDDLSNFFFIASKQNSGTSGANYPGNYEFRTKPNDGALEFLYQWGPANNATFIPSDTGAIVAGTWHHVGVSLNVEDELVRFYVDGEAAGEAAMATIWGTDETLNDEPIRFGFRKDGHSTFNGKIDNVVLWNEPRDAKTFEDCAAGLGCGIVVPDPTINGGGETYFQDFDEMETGRRLPRQWSGLTKEGSINSAVGLGLTDGFLTVPGSDDDGVLGVLNLGGNADSFGPAPDGFVPTWTAELGGDNNLYGRDDADADNASDRALGISRENASEVGELNFEIEISDNALRAFVFDWDLEIWGGDPDGEFRSPEGPGMKVDVMVGGTSQYTETKNLLPGTSFDSIEDGSSDHNATLIDGNVHSVRGMTSGIKEVSGADGAVGNMVHVNFNANWNDSAAGADGWFSAVDNVRFRALAPGDADANGVVDVTDLLQLLGGQKFNQGVDGVTWEQGDFNADDQFDTGDLLAMLSFLSGTFPSDPYASEAGGASDAVADIIVNSETGEVTVDLAGHTVSAVIIESASEIFNGEQPAWDTTSQFPSTLPGELGNVLFTSTASGTDELGAVISSEFLGRDKEFYLQDLDLNILIASEGGALTKGNVIVVPEPSTWLMLGLGSLLLVGWRQAKRSPGMN